MLPSLETLDIYHGTSFSPDCRGAPYLTVRNGCQQWHTPRVTYLYLANRYRRSGYGLRKWFGFNVISRLVLKRFEYRRSRRPHAVQRFAQPERAHVVPAGRHRRMLEGHGAVASGPDSVQHAAHVSHTAQGGQGEISWRRRRSIDRGQNGFV